MKTNSTVLEQHINSKEAYQALFGSRGGSSALIPMNTDRLEPEPKMPEPKMTVELCSAVHDIVMEFRQAHFGKREMNSQQRSSVVEMYPLWLLGGAQQRAIKKLSNPESYAAMRHGGRLLSPYPPLSDMRLRECCEEIRAALVWKSFVGLMPS